MSTERYPGGLFATVIAKKELLDRPQSSQQQPLLVVTLLLQNVYDDQKVPQQPIELTVPYDLDGFFGRLSLGERLTLSMSRVVPDYLPLEEDAMVRGLTRLMSLPDEEMERIVERTIAQDAAHRERLAYLKEHGMRALVQRDQEEQAKETE